MSSFVKSLHPDLRQRGVSKQALGLVASPYLLGTRVRLDFVWVEDVRPLL